MERELFDLFDLFDLLLVRENRTVEEGFVWSCVSCLELYSILGLFVSVSVSVTVTVR